MAWNRKLTFRFHIRCGLFSGFLQVRLNVERMFNALLRKGRRYPQDRRVCHEKYSFHSKHQDNQDECAVQITAKTWMSSKVGYWVTVRDCTYGDDQFSVFEPTCPMCLMVLHQSIWPSVIDLWPSFLVGQKLGVSNYLCDLDLSQMTLSFVLIRHIL